MKFSGLQPYGIKLLQIKIAILFYFVHNNDIHIIMDVNEY